MTGGDYQLRRTEERDADDLNRLYHRLTGIVRSEAQWRWEWCDGPYGRAPSWVIVDDATGAVVAHHGVVPLRLRLPDGAIVKACRTENTMIDPDYRKRVLYFGYEARLLKEIARDFDVVFTTSGKGAPAVVRKRLGYRTIGVWCTAPVLGHPLYRPAIPLPQSVTGLIPRLGGSGDCLAELTTDTARVAVLCAGLPAAAVSVDHSAEFLRWRFIEHPYNPYQLAIFRVAGRDAGYAAWRVKPRGGANDIIVDDIVLRDATPQRLREALCALRPLLPSQPSRFVLRSLRESGPLSQVIADAGHGAAADTAETELLARWSSGDGPLAWDVTPAIMQGI